MRAANLSAQNQRNAETGLVWELKVSNANTTTDVPKYSTLRITAVAACTVTLDGVASVYIPINETVLINVGEGTSSVANERVRVQFSAAVYCSVAKF